MIREGEPEVTLKYLAQNPQRKLAINSFTEGTSLDLEGWRDGGDAAGTLGASAIGLWDWP